MMLSFLDKTFVRFVNHPSMADVKNKSIFLHVCVPGQEDNAADYIGDFPTLDNIAEDLTRVLDKFEVKVRTPLRFLFTVNACLFQMENSNRILGIILVHCTSTTAGIFEYCKDKVINMRLENDIMTDGAWEYLVTHKFGTVNKKDRQMYVDQLKHTLNPRNLSKYLLAFTKRTDLSSSIGTKLDNVDTLLVSGSRASHLHTVYSTQKSMNRRKTTLLIVDNVADVLQEAPDKMARSFILLCKGCGVLSGVAIPGMERQRTLSRYEYLN
uniref:Sec1 family domain-containing protein 1 n=1 Tax=Angiostrongylus cantonensis TaxID=6313 RepID=A0A0K0D597_ANGCA